MQHKTWIVSGSIALAALATAPVWAQSDNDNANETGESAPQTGQASQASQPMQQAGQQGQPKSDNRPSNGPATPPPKPPPQAGQGMRHGPSHHRSAPPPPPRDRLSAKGMPLKHVCLNKTDAYSPGAVVKMNQKPYVCKADPNDASGVMHWMPMPEDS